ncbi:class I SAM-dependent methyltransferase [Glycomyces algeriensis]|uniref:Methylase n=1 Tax=Glycomyces algeriensis TaxID=256037 RepID=A0A9W6LID6_9ACTN|nr:class I SAM-dependent methyltransferase [Glycomyces algeriensis]MDA1368849.1 class I SAM-dependent methyltransferase [Glycomyces algeriensis]MDR7350865.1 methylase of polypeptide subunit release factors [Glycomyces algeriensis]GLI43576.1 methylase [Glycomyces algeriensis]
MSAISWTEADETRTAAWHSENATPPPAEVHVADDRMKADTAYRLAAKGTALLWRGDFHNARQLLRAMDRRIREPRGSQGTPAQTFYRHRQYRGHRARVLGRLIVVLGDGYDLDLHRAPDVRQACTEAYGPSTGPVAVAFTELQGVLSAHQWREKGVHIPALDASVHPHYGVFSPIRGEYIDLVANAPLPDRTDTAFDGIAYDRVAFDLGTGTGVLAAVLARRGFDRVEATDVNPRALACARDNAERLGLADRIAATTTGLYPDGRADLVVCNPPWLPGRPVSAVEGGVYDPDAAMLNGFLTGLTEHLRPGGEGWLVLSDLAEHLGLRTRTDLLDAIASAGLTVAGRLETRPTHPGPERDPDLLADARRREVTSLWRLRPETA